MGGEPAVVDQPGTWHELFTLLSVKPLEREFVIEEGNRAPVANMTLPTALWGTLSFCRDRTATPLTS